MALTVAERPQKLTVQSETILGLGGKEASPASRWRSIPEDGTGGSCGAEGALCPGSTSHMQPGPLRPVAGVMSLPPAGLQVFVHVAVSLTAEGCDLEEPDHCVYYRLAGFHVGLGLV